jgi:hypothetical protein
MDYISRNINLIIFLNGKLYNWLTNALSSWVKQKVSQENLKSLLCVMSVYMHKIRIDLEFYKFQEFKLRSV